MKYKEFREKNKGFKSRLEALLSICTPDPKGITLWSMLKKAYTQTELYDQVCSFCGLVRKLFPLSIGGVWQYYVGNPARERKGSLEDIGVVVKVRAKRIPTNKIITAYEKTDAGEDFGDPIAARATLVVNEFLSKKKKPSFCSLAKILGYFQKPPMTKQRRMYAVYEILKLFYRNPDSEFRWLDVVEETKLNERVVSDVLNSLGKAGIINYESPHSEIGGKRRNYVMYKVKNPDFLEENYEEIYLEVKKRRPYFTKRKYLSSIIKLIRTNPNEKYTSIKIAKELRIRLEDAITCLSALSQLGILQKEFSISKRSIAKANENTIILWERLLEPISRVAVNLNPYAYSGFFDILELYTSNKKLRIEHLQKQLFIFSLERSNIGREGGKEIKICILDVLGNREMKLSEIVEKVNEKILREVRRETVRRHLSYLVKIGKVKKTKKGFYKKL